MPDSLQHLVSGYKATEKKEVEVCQRHDVLSIHAIILLIRSKGWSGFLYLLERCTLPPKQLHEFPFSSQQIGSLGKYSAINGTVFLERWKKEKGKSPDFIPPSSMASVIQLEHMYQRKVISVERAITKATENIF